MIESFAKRFRDAGLSHRRAKTIHQFCYSIGVIIEDNLSGQFQRFACCIRGNKWVAVAVTANPRAKAYTCWQIVSRNVDAKSALKRVRKFLVDLRQSVDQTG